MSHAWSTHANKLIERTVKHPEKVCVWECSSKQGFWILYIFSQNLDAAKIVKTYQRALLTSAQWLTCYSGLHSRQMYVNPIENVWGLKKVKEDMVEDMSCTYLHQHISFSLLDAIAACSKTSVKMLTYLNLRFFLAVFPLEVEVHCIWSGAMRKSTFCIKKEKKLFFIIMQVYNYSNSPRNKSYKIFL